MSDIAITAANVLSSTTAQRGFGTSGATITAGQSLYIDTSDNNKLKLFDSDVAAPANVFAGIALHASLAGQPIAYVIADPSFTFGGTVLAGDTIWGADTAGGITKTFADLESGDTVVALGVALTTTTMVLNPTTGGPI